MTFDTGVQYLVAALVAGIVLGFIALMTEIRR